MGLGSQLGPWFVTNVAVEGFGSGACPGPGFSHVRVGHVWWKVPCVAAAFGESLVVAVSLWRSAG